MKPHLPVALILCSVLMTLGCPNNVRQDLSYDYNVLQTWTLDELGGFEVTQFETVVWAPEENVELRRLIVEDNAADGRTVLEIRTGTGVLSMLCAQHGANEVVATDINPAAVACARYNAAQLQLDETLKVRQVDADKPGAFAAIRDAEKFDLILSHPPSEEGQVNEPADHAFYDPEYLLLMSLLDGLPQHLKLSGRCLLSYSHVAAIKKVQKVAKERGFTVTILDQRDLDSLPPRFLPAMVVEIRIPIPKVEAKKVEVPETKDPS